MGFSFFSLTIFLWPFSQLYFVAPMFNSSSKEFMPLEVEYTRWKVLEKERIMLEKIVKMNLYWINFFCNLRLLVLLISGAPMFANSLHVCVILNNVLIESVKSFKTKLIYLVGIFMSLTIFFRFICNATFYGTYVW